MRILTVSKTSQIRYGSKWGTAFHNWVDVPFIRMSGKYLQKAGFNIGDSIEVEILDGFIILKQPSPARLKMEDKNPQLTHLINELNLIEVA